MVARFERGRSRSRPGLADRLDTATRYPAHALREILDQVGAKQAFASLGRNPDGSTTVTLRVLDSAGRFLPKALANGKLTDASEASALFAGLAKDGDPTARALVTESDGTLIQGWKYDVSAFHKVASQSHAESGRLALGENDLGEPTVVLFADEGEDSLLETAADSGMSSPPY